MSSNSSSLDLKSQNDSNYSLKSANMIISNTATILHSPLKYNTNKERARKNLLTDSVRKGGRGRPPKSVKIKFVCVCTPLIRKPQIRKKWPKNSDSLVFLIFDFRP